MAGIAVLQIYTFHDETPYNGSLEKPLEGDVFSNQSYESVLAWFVPAGGYDGVVTPEISPDGGTTWLNTDFRFLNNLSNRANSLDFSALGASTVAITFVMPEVFDVRMRLSGGSTGTITIKARITDGRYS